MLLFCGFNCENYTKFSCLPQYLNGQQIMEHAGGHLPFYTELDPATLRFDGENRLTVAINNTLTRETVPQGSVVWQTSSRYCFKPLIKCGQ